MKNILVPIGSSGNAIGTLQYAVDLAQALDANVYAVSVFQELSNVGTLTKANAIIRADTMDRLDEVMSKVDKKDVSVISHPTKGGVVDGIVRINKHVPIDLMVLAPKNNSISEELYLGNTTGKLLKGTNIPLLIVPDGTVFTPPKKILMAFKNGDFHKNKALAPVRQFIEHFGATLHVLHVATPETTEEMKQESENIKELQTHYERTENATTFQAVLEHFRQHDPDILCVVRRKRGFFQKLMEKNSISKREFHTSKPLLVLQVQK